VLSNGLVRRLIWVLFAIVFYQSGLTAAVWPRGYAPNALNPDFRWD
jgi:hypothetical protein